MKAQPSDNTSPCISRRTALSGGAAIAAIGVPADAASEDPAITAVREWAELHALERDLYERHVDVTALAESPEMLALADAVEAAYCRLAEVKPTSLAGMAALVRAQASQVRMDAWGARFEDLSTWDLLSDRPDGADADLLLAILAAGGQRDAQEARV